MPGNPLHRSCERTPSTPTALVEPNPSGSRTSHGPVVRPTRRSRRPRCAIGARGTLAARMTPALSTGPARPPSVRARDRNRGAPCSGSTRSTRRRRETGVMAAQLVPERRARRPNDTGVSLITNRAVCASRAPTPSRTLRDGPSSAIAGCSASSIDRALASRGDGRVDLAHAIAVLWIAGRAGPRPRSSRPTTIRPVLPHDATGRAPAASRPTLADRARPRHKRRARARLSMT